jgi:flavin reductase (DIM6/NTAB) family NADH-FMN oxidoreductase RutF
LALECKRIHTLELGLHTLFIGEVLDVKADEDILGEQGLPDMSKFKPFTYNPEIRTYFAVGDFIGKAFSIGKEIRSA